MSVSIVTRGLKEVEKGIKRDIKQARYAASVAMNQSAYEAMEAAKDEAKRDLDKPTPFTLKGIRYRKATKKNLEAAVYIAPIQSRYLKYQIEGGVRKGRSRAGEAIPVDIPLNQYGNIPGRHRGKIQKLLARKNTFMKTIGGVTGLWQRTGPVKAPKLKLLLHFVPRVVYRPRYSFYSTTAKAFEKAYPKKFEAAYKKALQTAR